MKIRLLIFSCLLLGLFACQREKAEIRPPFSLKVVTLEVAGRKIEVEVADTEQTMASGLMYRKSIPENHGMIFVFPAERRASFWMHNTYIPLDIAYLDRNGKILEVHSANPRDDTPISSETANVAYALEMNQGWFVNKGIITGALVKGLPDFPPRS